MHGNLAAPVLTHNNWERSCIDGAIGITRSIVIQVVDIEGYEEAENTNFDDCQILKIYGVTSEGNSVCLIVSEHFPYFYFQPPPGFSSEHLKTAERAINTSISKSLSSRAGTSTISPNMVHLQMTSGESLYNYKYDTEKLPFVKVLGNVLALKSAMDELKAGVDLMGRGPVNIGMLYEANIDWNLQFMSKYGVVGCGWIEIPVGKAQLVDPRKYISRCQLEAIVKAEDITVHNPEGDCCQTAPLRTLSFDIECLGRAGTFPQPTRDAVIQISNTLKIECQREPQQLLCNCFVLGTCASVENADIYECDSEQELLERWANFVINVDPDIITGYNVNNFDLPYLQKRAEILNVREVAFIGREFDHVCKIRQSRGGGFLSKTFGVCGRVVFDVLMILYRHYNLRSYKLNDVSRHFLQDEKEDVDHTIIPMLHNGDCYSRRRSIYKCRQTQLSRLALYCIKDSKLPLLLSDKLSLLTNYTELSKACGLPLNYLLTRDNKLMILLILMRKCDRLNIFLPSIEPRRSCFEIVPPRSRRFYNNMTSKLNMEHLYVHTIARYNLCYTTLMKMKVGVENSDYVNVNNKYCFSTSHKRVGILSSMAEKFIAHRECAKNAIVSSRDENARRIFISKHLTYTILSASIFEFVSDPHSYLPCTELQHAIRELSQK